MNKIKLEEIKDRNSNDLYLINICEKNIDEQGCVDLVKIWNICLDSFIEIYEDFQDRIDMNLLFENGAKVDTVDLLSRTPLMVACEYGYTEIAKYSIDNGIDINSVDYFSDTPLTISLNEGREDIAKLLIESGAEINVVNDNDETPLKLACEYGFTEIVKLLIDKKVNPYMKTYHEGYLILTDTNMIFNDDIMELLVDYLDEETAEALKNHQEFLKNDEGK